MTASRWIRSTIALALALQLFVAAIAAARADGPPGRYIVMLASSETNAFAPLRRSQVQELAREVGAQPEHVYDTVLNGFAGHLTPRQVQRLLQTGRVAAVLPDAETHLAAQTIPSGVQRIGTLANATAKIDGIDDPLPIDIAVLDTGIDPSHPDLNVVGGYDCSGSGSWIDRHGHGTHVAGIIGARDNGIGVVGVAPGARLWAVKVFGDNGTGYVSWLICGLNWVASNASTIRVANYSGGASGTDTPNCGGTSDPLHQAVCRVVQAGVTLVVAAGNDGRDASNTIPAAYPESITVGAIVDTDGQPGGLGPSTSYGADDTRASFSNYGTAVDLYAPGVSILSTVPGGGYQRWSGTSMATPHVTGAAALYLVQNPGASPAQVHSFLTSVGEAGSWDSFGQRLVRVDWSEGGSSDSGSGGGTTPNTRDVAIAGLSVPSTVTLGSSVTIQVTVRNKGTTSETVTVTLSANDNMVETPRSLSLAAGASSTVSFRWQPASAGTYILQATATISAEDADPSDNQRSATVTVTQQVRDVAITELSAPSSLTRGQSARVTVTLVNLGTSSVSVTVTLTADPRNAAMGTVSSKVSLSPGQTRTISFTWRTNSRTAPGTYTLIASAPLSDDANPADNTRTTTITVTSTLRR
ncbi:S8 family serine peptidase [Thermomicrobium sp. CFH 73360]|uniref:S8 family serine peptidase n=1 Tax=Thermomicrobium sp. CFH 73360 TaxID=2951987 RepID=UPI0020768FD4|nr:S8 family serine peptidase [Thermomicrobium sp. CFH 73360]MCM8745522.1 S8 family serine peptidase [Thermomicrobium sp. CFH 73360]